MITALVSERLDGRATAAGAGLPGLRHRRVLPPARGRPSRPPGGSRPGPRGRPSRPPGGLMIGASVNGAAAGPPDPQALLALARSAAEAAAAMLAARRPAGPQGRPEVASTKSSPTDVVTEMDRAAEAMIAGRILAERPGDAILGEEGGEVRSRPGPLDRRPAGRHRQLPVRPAGLGGEHRRRGGRRGRRRGGGGPAAP